MFDLGLWWSWEKVSFIECKFYDTNSFKYECECECKFYHKLTILKYTLSVIVFDFCLHYTTMYVHCLKSKMDHSTNCVCVCRFYLAVCKFYMMCVCSYTGASCSSQRPGAGAPTPRWPGRRIHQRQEEIYEECGRIYKKIWREAARRVGRDHADRPMAAAKLRDLIRGILQGTIFVVRDKVLPAIRQACEVECIGVFICGGMLRVEFVMHLSALSSLV